MTLEIKTSLKINDLLRRNQTREELIEIENKKWVSLESLKDFMNTLKENEYIEFEGWDLWQCGLKEAKKMKTKELIKEIAYELYFEDVRRRQNDGRPFNDLSDTAMMYITRFIERKGIKLDDDMDEKK